MASIRYRKTSTGGERWQVQWRDAARRQRSVTFDDPVMADLLRNELERVRDKFTAEELVLAKVLDMALEQERDLRSMTKRSRTKLARRLSGSSTDESHPPGFREPEQNRPG